MNSGSPDDPVSIYGREVMVYGKQGANLQEGGDLLREVR